ncbi:GntR family transcriptional regulator [Bradyrhizobium sp. SSUT18]|uniref:GntR family transcriptional regulator n=1 Tax=Bradyrhizobium sp. SSUT18 TaxID=3040602 RepID=UPI00244B1E56|nr:GntR family transcriptional regulator [Bradyrhizobium sp. SSUT18]MDH2406632.1 GntR family transcriptional regulator [Bradyrhizobium sp. SSUT18]
MTRTKETGPERIRNGVLELIQQQNLSFGEKLPTEEKLTELLKVSRPALREGLKRLEQEGIIDVVHGKGRFVAAGSALNIDRPITKFESVTDMVRTHGYRTTVEVLGFGVVPANKQHAQELQVAEGSPLLRLERLRRAKNEAIVYSIDLVPRNLIGEGLHSHDLSGSLLELLSGHDVRPVASTAKVSAVNLPKETIELHGLHDFGPALKITELCFTERGQPVVIAEVYHSGSAFSFSFVRR